MILLNNHIDPTRWNELSNNQIFFRYELLYVIQNTYHLEPCFVLCSLGDNFMIAHGASIISGAHVYTNDIPMRDTLEYRPVIIGNNVWIGANGVVTKNIESNSVAVGIPAKIIKKF